MGIVTIYRCCPKCGNITSFKRPDIPGASCSCGCSTQLEIDPKWEITEEKRRAIFAALDSGEKTKEECRTEWKEHCRPFIEEVVMPNPEFDQWSHDHYEELSAKRSHEVYLRVMYHQDEIEAELEARELNIHCPYCQSPYTRKILKPKSRFPFNLFPKKDEKKWHCDQCNSDF